jgi:amino acid transporter
MALVPLHKLKQLFVGTPLPTAQSRHERLGKAEGLAIFASDPLSSVAYATEAILLVLVVAGPAALSYSLPIGVCIAALILIVITSYRQTIRAYPRGGGAYIVAKDNLGTNVALVAGGALLIDYVLTVAVSVTAGVEAITSAIPVLLPYRIWLSVGAIALITTVNLRGVRESGHVFAAPTYLFVVSILAMIGWGLLGTTLGRVPEAPYEAHAPGLEGIGLFLLLRAFAAGCTALTGVEAVSDGVPAFKPPEAHNARIVMGWLGVLSVTMFLGITYLAYDLGIVPGGHETVVSKIARRVFGEGLLYYEVQAVTMLILLLAANTAFADFPRVSSIIASDGYLPRQLANRGDRLVFSNGILVLAAVAAVLIVVFGGETTALIPLYAVGVFTGFTLSQYGMVRHHRRVREKGWRRNQVVNVVGAVATLIVLVVVVVSKFAIGAWIPVVLIPLVVLFFKSIGRHYRRVAMALAVPDDHRTRRRTHTVVIPVGNVHRGVLDAVSYARTLAPDRLIAVSVVTNPEEQERITQQFAEYELPVELRTIYSPYRELTGPLLRFIDEIDQDWPDDIITVIVPEFVLAHWWEQLLHNQSALVLRARLRLRRNTVVTSVPTHIYRAEDERYGAGP